METGEQKSVFFRVVEIFNAGACSFRNGSKACATSWHYIGRYNFRNTRECSENFLIGQWESETVIS